MLRTRVRIGPASGLVISLLFAVIFTVVGSFEVLVPQLGPTFGVATPTALRVPYRVGAPSTGGAELNDASRHHRQVVVPRGTVLRTDRPADLAVMKWEEARRPVSALRLGSAFLLYFVGCLMMANYFVRFGHGRLKLVRSQIGLFGLIGMALLIAKACLVFTAYSPMWLPVTAAAFWVAIGFDRRTAILVDVGISFMVASLLRFDLLLLTVLITRGVVATLLFLNRKQPRQILVAGLFSGLVSAVAFMALTVVLEGPNAVARELTASLSSDVVACVGGGLFSGLLATVLREPAELLLGHVSRNRLLDLTDIEAPLLRKMATEAPGSWEHSRAMANLAEAASASIGADSLLTRVGAYYHDLGKTVQPKYFVENTASGETSPHDELAPEVSADAIMAHVVLGTKVLREGGVPEPVVEFAYTHHGTQLVEYFWGKYRQQHEADVDETGERLLDDSSFRYPGMKPMSKETAILMLVDAVEAASRTIVPPTHENFQDLIQRIVFSKVRSGQLDDSGLTITDLRVMTERMASTLVNMYHGRIKYPWQRKKEAAEAKARADKSAQRAKSSKSAERRASSKSAERRAAGKGARLTVVAEADSDDSDGPDRSSADDSDKAESQPRPRTRTAGVAGKEATGGEDE